MKNARLLSMIAVCAAMLLAGCSNGTDEPATYTVTVTSSGNGTAAADKTTAEAGVTITLTAMPNNGYEFKQWTVLNGDVELSSPTTETATFTMPAANVSVKAEFIVRGVLINGTVWALCNVDAPGTFAVNPEDAGMFYQWNREVGWSSADPMINSNGGSTWNDVSADGNEWEAANDPCPAGWRIPTQDELAALCDDDKTTSEWTTLNGVNGRVFTDNVNSVFFPAAGRRTYFNGGLYYSEGYYWSSNSRSAIETIALSVDIDAAVVTNYNCANGFSVRCVAK